MAISMHADVNNVSYAGKPVFLFACEQAEWCENLCMRLLESGADPNATDLVCLHTVLMLTLSHSTRHLPKKCAQLYV